MFQVYLLTADDRFPIIPTRKGSGRRYSRGRGLWNTSKAAEDWVKTLKEIPSPETSRTFIITEVPVVG